MRDARACRKGGWAKRECGVQTYYRQPQSTFILLADIMRTLLRHTITGLYFQGPEKWTSDPDRAYDFHFIDRAVEFVDNWSLTEVELAFAFDDPQTITTVPLERTACRQAA